MCKIHQQSLVFTISNATLNPGEKTTFKLVGNNGELSIQNNGANKKYNLQIQEIGDNNNILIFNNVSIDKNMTQNWKPTNWDNLGISPITLTEDKNSDGKNVTTNVANALTINSGAKYTNSRKVTLNFASPITATKMRISNLHFNKNQQYYPKWQNFTNSLDWSLLGGEGNQTVYVQFMEADGKEGNVYSSSIILDTLPPFITDVFINNGKPIVTTTAVTVKINTMDSFSGIQSMKVSNNNDLSNVTWRPYQSTFNWTLSPVSNNLPQLRWVYVQLMDAAGNISKVFKKPILLLP